MTQDTDRAALLSALDWWLAAGVDTPTAEAPRDWLAAPAPVAPVEYAPVQSPAPAPSRAAPAPTPAPPPTPTPDTLAAFRAMLENDETLPFVTRGAARILPRGPEGAPLMVLAGIPGRDEAAGGEPIGGAALALARRMLAAIGLDADDCYLAALACGYAPAARGDAAGLARCAQLARDHVRLARPARLLLLGDGPAEALLGSGVARARGRLHKVEGVRTVATFAPRYLLSRPSDKALAWKDLQLLMSEEP